MRIEQFDRAEELLEEVVADTVVDGPRCMALHSLGDLALRRGDAEGALAWYGAALSAAPSVGFDEMVVVVAAGAAAAAAAAGDADGAARLWGALQRLEDEWGPVAFAEREFYATMVGDPVSHRSFRDARSLSLEDARRLVAAYVHSE